MGTTLDREVTVLVERYVKETRGWPSSDYRTEINRREGKVIIVWVIHRDDEATPVPGGGRSFEAHVDAGRMQVVKELRFQ
jgi:hypothetical protein